MRSLTLLLFLVPLIVSAQVKYSNEGKKLYNKAVKEYKDGHEDESLSLFEQCVKVEPAYAEAFLNISIIQYRKNLMGDALVNAQKAFWLNKYQAEIYAQLGKCYYQANNYDSSYHFLSKAVEMEINDEFTFIYLGKSAHEMEDYDGAVEHFNAAITLNDKNPVSFNSRGKSNFELGEFDYAEADFKKALELNPNSVGIYSNLANTLLSNGKSEEALDYINKGIEKSEEGGTKIQFYVLLGNYYHLNGQYELALENFEKAYELDDSNASLLNNQAAVFLDQDDYESAVTKCNEALDLDPELMEAYFNRGIANEMLRNVLEACSDWEQAFILGSEKAEEYLNSATCNE